MAKQLALFCVLLLTFGFAYANSNQTTNNNTTTNQTNNSAFPSLQERANSLDSLINGNNNTPVDKNPSLAKDWQNRITVSGQINADGRAQQ